MSAKERDQIGTVRRAALADRPAGVQYAVALGLTGIALLLRMLAAPYFGQNVPYLWLFAILLPLVVLVRPGPFLVSALLGLGATWYFILPHRSEFGLRDRDEVLNTAIVAGASLTACLAAIASHRVQQRFRAAGAARRASEERLRALVTASSDVIYRMSADWEELHPLDGRGLVASNGAPVRGWMEKYVPPSEHARVSEAITRARATKSLFELEHRVFLADGSTGWTLSRAVPVFGPEGEVVEWFGAASDITRRKQAEEELARRSEQLRLVTDAMPGLIAYVDRQERYRFVNKAYEDWFGVRSADIEGKHVRGVVGDAGYEKLKGYIDAALAGNGVRFEIEVPYPRGGPRHVQAEYVPDARPDGTIAGYYAFVADVTARARAERSLRANEERLRLATEVAAMLSWECDVASDTIVWSSNAAAVIGCAQEDLPRAMSRSDFFVAPDEAAWLWERFNALLRARGEKFTWEFRGVGDPAEAKRWLSLGRVLYAEDGTPTRIVGVTQDVTDQRRAQDALKRTTQSLGLAMRGGRMGWWSRDLRTNTVEWSPELEEIFGLRRGGFAGTERAFFDLVHPDDRAPVGEAVARAVAEKTDYAVEFRFRHADGSWRWMDGRGRATYSAVGEPEWIFGIGIDITDRRAADTALRESESRLRAMFDQAAVGIAVADLEGRFLEMNHKFEEILGYGPGELIGKTALDITHRDDVHATARNMRRLIAGVVPSFRMEKRHLRKDGSEVWSLSTVTTIRDAAGSPLRFLGVIEDITARKHAEQALRTSEDRYRAIVESQTEMVCRFRVDGEILFVNAAYARARGVTPGDLIGKNFWAFIPEEDRAGVRAMLGRLTPESPRVAIENRFETAEGPRWTLWTNTALRFDGGVAVEAQSSGIDITDRKLAEQALRTSEERLRLATEGAGVGTWEFDFATGRGSWSSEATALLGVDRLLHTAGDLVEGVHPDDRARAAEAWRRAVEENAPYEVEFRTAAPAADGGERWLLSRGRIERDEHGAPVRAAGVGLDVTARKRAEAALQDAALSLARQRERLEVALRAGRLGVYEWRIGDAAVWWSPETYPLYGVDPATFTPTVETFTALVHPDDREELWRKSAESIERAQVFTHEYRIVHPDGSVRWIFNRSQVGLDASGKPERITGVAADITERKDAEQKLRDSENRFRQLADAMPQLVWVAESGGTVVYYNSQAARYGGISHMTGSRHASWAWQPVVHPDDLDATIAAWRRAVESGETYECEHRVRMTDGGFRWHLSRAYPAQTPEGTRWYGTATDIHDLKAAEETLRESDAHLRLALDAGRLGDWSWDAASDEVEFGRRGAEIFGVAPDTPVTWTSLRAMMPPDDAQLAAAAVVHALESRGDYAVEYRVRRASDGQEVWVSARGRGVYAADGSIAGMTGVVQDVTAGKRAEDELRLHRERLQELVDQRTAELEASQQRLRFAERMAALGTLATGLGHDMGNLLVPVRVRLETLERMELPESALKELEGLRASAGYLQKLAGGLRLLASTPAKTNAEPTDIGPWWTEAEPVLRNTLPRGVVLVGEFPEGDCRVKVGRAALMQAVFNLVQNAADAMRGLESGRVAVRAHCEDDAVVMRVVDNGPGMTEEVKQRCMEPFFTTKTRGLSTGLGLALVYGIVQEAGGTIELDSRLGVGTTFTLRLPRATGSASRPAAARTAIVEVKDARTRAFVTAELRSLNFVVRSAADVASADLAVIDGPRDGLAAARVLAFAPGAKLSDVKSGIHDAARATATAGCGPGGA